MRVELNQLSDTEEFSHHLAQQLAPGDLVLLYADLGLGKTTLLQYLLKHWGVTEVYSPTYSLHNFYQTKEFELHHFDLYRLETSFELEEVGFYDQLAKPNAICLVEWAQRLTDKALPLGRKQHRIAIFWENEKRILTWSQHG